MKNYTVTHNESQIIQQNLNITNNLTNIQPSNEMSHSTNTSAALVVAYSLPILNILFNLFTLTIFFRRKKSTQSFSNMFLSSLFISDLLQGCVLLLTLVLLPNRYLSLRFISYVLVLASVSNVCLITTDRYIQITRHLRYRSIITEERARSTLVAVWVTPIIVSIVDQSIILIYGFHSSAYNIMLMIVDSLLTAMCAFIVLANYNIWKVARRHARAIQQTTVIPFDGETVETPPATPKTPLTTIYVVISAIFVTTFMPSVIADIVHITQNVSERSHITVVKLLLYVNGITDPIVYALFKKSFLEEIRSLFK